MDLPHKVTSMDELKSLATGHKLECILQLAGGICHTTKYVHYYPGEDKPWCVFGLDDTMPMDDGWVDGMDEYTDEELARNTNVPLGVERGALIIQHMDED